MTTKKPKPVFFQTVADMLIVPTDKIDQFCEDLRLWLHMHRQVKAIQRELGVELKVTTPTHMFGWVDDGRHDAEINISINGVRLEPGAKIVDDPPAADAVDPQASNSGTPSTRA